MDVEETIILPLPGQVADIARVADDYLEQYGTVAQLAIRGSVQMEQGHIVRIPDWRTIAQIDRALGLLGLGDLGEAEELLLWVNPCGPGELRISALEEEM